MRSVSPRNVELIADRRTYEQRVWDDFALALILPRHFPEHVSDADISATLRHVAATELLPWTIPDL
jgi:hypothetical protein